MNPQQFLKEIAGEIRQTTMGKENDSQSVREGKKTQPKRNVDETTDHTAQGLTAPGSLIQLL